MNYLLALKNGNIEKLIHPTDSEGRKCGIDSQVKNKPYLIFFDLTKCARISPQYRTCNTTQVCIEKCPQSNFLYDEERKSGTIDIEQLKKKLICKTDVKLEKIHRFDDIDTLVSREKCAKWYLSSTSIIGRCFPKEIWPGFVKYTIDEPDLQRAKSFVQTVANVEDILKKAYEDIKQTK